MIDEMLNENTDKFNVLNTAYPLWEYGDDVMFCMKR